MRPEDPARHQFLELIAWLGDKLERLRSQTSDAYDRATLLALSRACDPRTNPRLAAALAATGAHHKKEDRRMETTSEPKRRRRGARQATTPGVRTTEFWSVAGVMAASLATCLDADEPGVRIAGIVATASLGCVLGGLYIWSRTKVKTQGGSGGDDA